MINSIKVLELRYLLRDREGNLIETPGQLFHCVAHTLTSIETQFEPGAIFPYRDAYPPGFV